MFCTERRRRKAIRNPSPCSRSGKRTARFRLSRNFRQNPPPEQAPEPLPARRGWGDQAEVTASCAAAAIDIFRPFQGGEVAMTRAVVNGFLRTFQQALLGLAVKTVGMSRGDA